MRRHAIAPLAVLVLLLAACAERIDDIEDHAALFSRPWLEPIYPDDRPRAGELARPVEVSAALGEREPASVGLRARVALSGVSARIEGLGPGWGELRLTRFIPPLERWRPLPGRALLPGYLDPLTTFDVPAGETRQIWIDIRVPLDAEAGRHEGRLVVEAQEGLPQPLVLPLVLEVRPYALDPARADLFAYGENHVLDPRALADAREHGMNTLLVSQNWTKDATPVYTEDGFDFRGVFDDLVRVVEAAHAEDLAEGRRIGVFLYWHLTEAIPRALAEAGIRHPRVEAWGRRLHYDLGYELLYEADARFVDVERHRPWRKGDGTGAWEYRASRDPYAAPDTAYGRKLYEGWVASMRALDALAEEKGWPGFYYYLIDEPHHSRGALRLALAMGRASEEAGSLSLVTCNEPSVSEPREDKLWFPALGPEPALRLGDWLDVRVYANKYLGPATLERTREAGDAYGTYVNVYGGDPASVRFQAGALAWRLDLDVLMFWAWHYSSAPSGDFRAHLRDWEAAREGIDDLRYLATLERLVANVGGSSRARGKAEALLAELRETIPSTLAGSGRIDSESGRYVPGQGEWGELDFERLRARVAGAVEDMLAEHGRR